MTDNLNPQAPTMPQSPPGAPAASPPPVTPTAPYVIDPKSPLLAGVLSMFPGLGHLYLGLYQRAFGFGGAFILGIAFTSGHGPAEFLGPVIAFIWFFAIIDAVRQAKAINRGQVAEAGLAGSELLRRAAAGTGALTWGVILIGLGALWLIDRYIEIDWSFMEDWGGPLAFILLGFVLIVSHIRKRRRENEQQVGMPPRST